ncbi:hypothetical protein H4R20_003660 [Coemansia guatemalensis]|uniref:Uncharacterized protein n=1 Tax=Coemansia guatemalensis TaxID=2761395 RepID=A0A9W8HUT8_9FUNG|nr:hypothetical protein H4R20_003660 [Coemansia guatemalensis]
MDAEGLYWDQYGCEDNHITQPQHPSQLQAVAFSSLATKPQSRWSLLPGAQPTEGSGSSRDSYWPRYSYAHGSATDQCTPVYGNSIEPFPQRQQQQQQQPLQQRLFVVPDRLAALHISTSDDEDHHSSSMDELAESGPAFQIAGSNHEPSIVQHHATAAADKGGNEQLGPCDSTLIAGDGCEEGGLVPLSSSPVSGFQGVNPAALITRLSFLKQQMEQDEQMVLGTATAV